MCGMSIQLPKVEKASPAWGAPSPNYNYCIKSKTRLDFMCVLGVVNCVLTSIWLPKHSSKELDPSSWNQQIYELLSPLKRKKGKTTQVQLWEILIYFFLLLAQKFNCKKSLSIFFFYLPKSSLQEILLYFFLLLAQKFNSRRRIT